MGFKLNPYNLCVANSQSKGKQCTIAWYVDDNKISHVDGTVVTDIIEKNEAKFGKMTVTRGKHHVFLGMDINFNDNDGTVTILMKEYLKEVIANSGMDASKVALTPAKKDLFTVDDVSEVEDFTYVRKDDNGDSNDFFFDDEGMWTPTRAALKLKLKSEHEPRADTWKNCCSEEEPWLAALLPVAGDSFFEYQDNSPRDVCEPEVTQLLTATFTAFEKKMESEICRVQGALQRR